MGQNLPRPGNDCRCCRPPRSSRHHLRDERQKLPPPCRARTKARSRPPARPRDNRGQCLIVAPRQYKSSIPLARQSRHGNHANVATPDSHPDCRVFPSRSPRYSQRKPINVIHHSDQGTQYTSLAFGGRCREAGVRPSMGSVGDAYDNAMCESFFATLECELLARRRFTSQAEARMAVFSYIEGWYNPARRHSGIRYFSPIAYETQMLRETKTT